MSAGSSTLAVVLVRCESWGLMIPSNRGSSGSAASQASPVPSSAAGVMSDDVNPNAAGQQLWTKTVLTAFGLPTQQ